MSISKLNTGALVVGLITLVSMVAMSNLGATITTALHRIASSLEILTK